MHHGPAQPVYAVPTPYAPQYAVPRPAAVVKVGGWWMALLPIGLAILFGLISAAGKRADTVAESAYRLEHPVTGGVVGGEGLVGVGWLAVFVVMFLLRRWRMPARIIGYIGIALMLIGSVTYSSGLDRYAHTAAQHNARLHFSGGGATVFAAFFVAAAYTMFEIMTRRAYRRMAARYGM